MRFTKYIEISFAGSKQDLFGMDAAEESVMKAVTRRKCDDNPGSELQKSLVSIKSVLLPRKYTRTVPG